MANLTKFARIIRSAEEQVSADTESIRTELAHISQALPVLEEKAQDIIDGLGAADEVRSKWSKGIDVPALDFAVATAEDEKTVYMAKALAARGDALSRRLPADKPLLADHIAPAFAGVLPGVEVIPTTAPLNVWKREIASDTLAVVVYQGPKIETNPFTGELSGEVTAYFIRSGLMRPINVDTFERYARSQRISLEVTSNNVGDESGWVAVAGSGGSDNETDPSALVVDSLTIRVAGVLNGLPVIREIESNSPVKDMVLRTFSTFRPLGIISTARVIVESNPPEGTDFVIRYDGSTAMGAPKSVDVTEENGERTVTVRQVVNITNADPISFVESVRELVDGSIGGVTIGMGLLTGADIDGRSSRIASTDAIEFVLTYKSRTA